MSLNIKCANCQALLTLGDALAGTQIKCTTCGARLNVPKPAPPPTPTAQPPAPAVDVHPAASGAAGGASKVFRWGLISSLALTGLVVVIGGVAAYSMSGRLHALQNDVKGFQKTMGEDAQAEKKRIDVELQKTEGELRKAEDELNKAKTDLAQHSTKLGERERAAYQLRSDMDDLDDKIGLENQKQETDYKERIAALKKELDDKTAAWKNTTKDVTDIKGKMIAAGLRVNSLNKRVETLESKSYKDQRLWAKVIRLQRQLNALPTPATTPISTAENVVTITGEDVNNWGRVHVFTLDTKDGFVKYSRRVGANYSVSIPEGFARPQAGVAGRFDMKVTFDAVGDVYDVVRLDTQTGKIWSWRVSNVWTTPLPGWKYVNNTGQTAATVNRWRLDVDSSNAKPGVAGPGITVTDTKNRVAYGDYLNTWFHRSMLLRVHRI